MNLPVILLVGFVAFLLGSAYGRASSRSMPAAPVRPLPVWRGTWAGIGQNGVGGGTAGGAGGIVNAPNRPFDQDVD